jgi:hypothetical protein
MSLHMSHGRFIKQFFTLVGLTIIKPDRGGAFHGPNWVMARGCKWARYASSGSIFIIIFIYNYSYPYPILSIKIKLIYTLFLSIKINN